MIRRALRLLAVLILLSAPGWAEQSHPESIGWSRDGRLVAACGSTGATVFDSASGRVVCHVTPPAMPTGVAISPDGKTLAVGTLGSRIFVYSLPAGKQLHEMQGDKRFGGGFGVTFNADGRWLITTGFSVGRPTPDTQVRIWDIPTGQIVSSMPGPQGDVSPHGQWLVARNKVEERVIVQPVPAGRRQAFNAARLPFTPFRNDDKRLAIVDDEARQLQMIDLPAMTTQNVFPIEEKKAIFGMSSDFLYLVMSYTENDRELGDIDHVVVTRLKDRKKVAHVKGKHLQATIISAQHIVAVEAPFEGEIRLVSIASGQQVAGCKGGDYPGVHEYMQYGFSPDGRQFAIWDTQMGQKLNSLRVFDGLTGKVRWTKPVDQ